MRRGIRCGATSLEHVDDGLVTIIGETERLKHLLSLLLDMSRIQAGRLDISRRSVNIGQVAAAVVAEVQTTTERHQIRLRRSGDLTGQWDESRLQQVIANLLTNAIKYSPDGGVIDVTVRGDATDVRVSVRDHGVGLTPQEAEHVFERFFRAASIRQLEGSGLGLYICQSIVTAHGGRIWVESDGPGHGTAFSFVLHRTNPKEYSTDQQPPRLTQETKTRARRNGVPNTSVPPTSKRAELVRA
jgi:signal transduction histidine kinase